MRQMLPPLGKAYCPSRVGCPFTIIFEFEISIIIIPTHFVAYIHAVLNYKYVYALIKTL